MADEHQDTLKKKIQILFQLGKWPDVLKLCQSYSEKYGKEVEIDMIRFKCERHLGIQQPETKPEPASGPAAPEEKERPLDLALAETIVSRAPVLSASPEEAAPSASVPREKDAYDPDSGADEVDIGNPFAADELVVTDPFADEAPGVSISPGEPPVVIPEEVPGLELESVGAHGGEPPAGEKEIDFGSMGGATIDAEPELISSAAVHEEAVREAEPFASSMFGRVETGAENREQERQPAPVKDEPPPRRSPLLPPTAEETSAPKRRFNFKLALLAVVPLLVAALWLALSGKLGSGDDQPQPVPEPVAARPAPRRPRPVQPATPMAAQDQTATALAPEQERLFAEKWKLAEELNRKGDLLHARAAVREAKKIKVTEALERLEQELDAGIRQAEAAAAAAATAPATPAAPQTDWERETEALGKAKEADTIAGWQDFIRAFPSSESLLQAQNRIVFLEKKARNEAEQQQLLRIQQAQKIRLRSAYASLGQAEVAAQARTENRPPARYEAHAHGGVTVTLDLTSGLMWSLYGKPMAYDKARWWANRVTAGYGGWRLPTIEEALTLLQMDRGQYSGLADFAVWTGDSASEQPRSGWVLKLPAGQFVPVEYGQMFYVWAVRSAGK